MIDAEKIAILRPNSIGDFVFSLPCLHALKAAYPQSRIVYIGKPWHADFLADRPGPIDEVVVIPPCPGVGEPPGITVDPHPIARFLDEMRARRFDLAVQIYGGGKYSNPFIRQFGARLTIGMKSADAPPLDRWVTYGALQNRRLQMLEVAALVGADCLRLGPELQTCERDRHEARNVLDHALDLRANEPLVLIQPGANDRRRCWPPERFASVADSLTRQGARIAVNGTREEADIVHAVIAHMHHPAIDLSGRLSLSGLCGILSQTAMLVSNDTGPLHLAIALGVPSVGIYWLTNLIESGPLCQHAHRALLSTRLACPVCGADNRHTRCAHELSFIDDVPLADVEAAALDLFAGSNPRACPPRRGGCDVDFMPISPCD